MPSGCTGIVELASYTREGKIFRKNNCFNDAARGAAVQRGQPPPGRVRCTRGELSWVFAGH